MGAKGSMWGTDHPVWFVCLTTNIWSVEMLPKVKVWSKAGFLKGLGLRSIFRFLW